MEIQGKVIAVMEPKSGVSARGEWKAQDYVIETHDAYPRKMVFSVFGADRIATTFRQNQPNKYSPLAFSMLKDKRAFSCIYTALSNMQ